MSHRPSTGCPSRGSVLLLGYFVVVVMLGIAIPQTMRSMSGVRLEQRFANQQQLAHAAEANLDQTVRTLWITPTLGNAPYTGGCGGWDCFSGTVLYGIAPNSAQIQVRTETTVSTTGMVTRDHKRIRVSAISGLTSQVATYEAIVEVEGPASPGIRVGKRLLMKGGGAIPSELRADEIVSYGGQIFPGQGPPIELQGQTSIYGRVLVETPLDGSLADDDLLLLCCANVGSPSYISLANGTIYSSGGELLAVGEPVGVVNPSHPEAPGWTGATFAPEPILDSSGVCSDASASTDLEIGVSEQWNFCPTTDTTGTCDPAQKIGRVAPDGAVEYCFHSLDIAQSATAAFQGDNVRVYLTGHFGEPKRAIRTQPQITIFSFKPGAPAIPSQANVGELSINIHASNAPDVQLKFGGSAAIWGSINAPFSEVLLGVGSDIIDLPMPTYIVADNLEVSSGSHVTINSQGGGGGGAPARNVRVLAWRKCLNTACTQ